MSLNIALSIVGIFCASMFLSRFNRKPRPGLIITRHRSVNATQSTDKVRNDKSNGTKNKSNAMGQNMLHTYKAR